MVRFLLPAVFVAAAFGLFFGYVDPAYQKVKELQTEVDRFDEALDRSRELAEIKNQLLSRYNSFSSNDLERLQKLLPDNIDNVRLVLDLDGIARTHNMLIQNVTVSADKAASVQSSNTLGSDPNPYLSVALSFSVTATYEDFIDFIKDLESSLRLVDAASVTFTPRDDTNRYDYQISLSTYWLK